MPFSGQPYADATAGVPTEPSLDAMGAGPFGLDAGARDPFQPPSLVADQTTQGPVPAIDAVQQERINPLQMDFQDPTNLFAPGSGPVAERFRTLQGVFGSDMQDEAPLTGMQVLALSLAAIANPEAVQEAMKARRERRDQTARDRRVMNQRLLEVASESVAQEQSLALQQARLRVSVEQLNATKAANAKAAALADAEIAKHAEHAALMRQQRENLARLGQGAGGAPRGFETTRVTTNSEGKTTFTSEQAEEGYNLLWDGIKKIRGTGQFGATAGGYPEVREVEEAEALVLANPDLTPIQINAIRAAADRLRTGQPGRGHADVQPGAEARGPHSAGNRMGPISAVPGGFDEATLEEQARIPDSGVTLLQY